MSRRAVWTRPAAIVVSIVVAVLAAGCTSGSTKATHDRATPTPTPSPSALSSVETRLLGGPSVAPSTTAPAPLASATAAIHLIGIDRHTTRLTAAVTRVTVSGATTVVSWRLSSPDGSTVSASGNWASGGTSSATDTRAVALVDTAARVRLLPYVNAGQAVFGESDCTCSDTPRSVSAEPSELYATYPALSAAATTVTVAVPGFPAMTGIPVSRG